MAPFTRESVADRLAAVNTWLENHKPGALLKLDINAQKRSGGILAE
jgi:hypothetical protein